jgi:hypothetical protein
MSIPPFLVLKDSEINNVASSDMTDPFDRCTVLGDSEFRFPSELRDVVNPDAVVPAYINQSPTFVESLSYPEVVAQIEDAYSELVRKCNDCPVNESKDIEDLCRPTDREKKQQQILPNDIRTYYPSCSATYSGQRLLIGGIGFPVKFLEQNWRINKKIKINKDNKCLFGCFQALSFHSSSNFNRLIMSYAHLVHDSNFYSGKKISFSLWIDFLLSLIDVNLYVLYNGNLISLNSVHQHRDTHILRIAFNHCWIAKFTPVDCPETATINTFVGAFPAIGIPNDESVYLYRPYLRDSLICQNHTGKHYVSVTDLPISVIQLLLQAGWKIHNLREYRIVGKVYDYVIQNSGRYIDLNIGAFDCGSSFVYRGRTFRGKCLAASFIYLISQTQVVTQEDRKLAFKLSDVYSFIDALIDYGVQFQLQSLIGNFSTEYPVHHLMLIDKHIKIFNTVLPLASLSSPNIFQNIYAFGEVTQLILSKNIALNVNLSDFDLDADVDSGDSVDSGETLTFVSIEHPLPDAEPDEITYVCTTINMDDLCKNSEDKIETPDLSVTFSSPSVNSAESNDLLSFGGFDCDPNSESPYSDQLETKLEPPMSVSTVPVVCSTAAPMQEVLENHDSLLSKDENVDADAPLDNGFLDSLFPTLVTPDDVSDDVDPLASDYDAPLWRFLLDKLLDSFKVLKEYLLKLLEKLKPYFNKFVKWFSSFISKVVKLTKNPKPNDVVDLMNIDKVDGCNGEPVTLRLLHHIGVFLMHHFGVGPLHGFVATYLSSILKLSKLEINPVSTGCFKIALENLGAIIPDYCFTNSSMLTHLNQLQIPIRVWTFCFNTCTWVKTGDQGPILYIYNSHAMWTSDSPKLLPYSPIEVVTLSPEINKVNGRDNKQTNSKNRNVLVKNLPKQKRVTHGDLEPDPIPLHYVKHLTFDVKWNKPSKRTSDKGVDYELVRGEIRVNDVCYRIVRFDYVLSLNGKVVPRGSFQYALLSSRSRNAASHIKSINDPDNVDYDGIFSDLQATVFNTNHESVYYGCANIFLFDSNTGWSHIKFDHNAHGNFDSQIMIENLMRPFNFKEQVQKWWTENSVESKYVWDGQESDLKLMSIITGIPVNDLFGRDVSTLFRFTNNRLYSDALTKLVGADLIYTNAERDLEIDVGETINEWLVRHNYADIFKSIDPDILLDLFTASGQVVLLDRAQLKKAVIKKLQNHCFLTYLDANTRANLTMNSPMLETYKPLFIECIETARAVLNTNCLTNELANDLIKQKVLIHHENIEIDSSVSDDIVNPITAELEEQIEPSHRIHLPSPEPEEAPGHYSKHLKIADGWNLLSGFNVKPHVHNCPRLTFMCIKLKNQLLETIDQLFNTRLDLIEYKKCRTKWEKKGAWYLLRDFKVLCTVDETDDVRDTRFSSVRIKEAKLTVAKITCEVKDQWHYDVTSRADAENWFYPYESNVLMQHHIFYVELVNALISSSVSAPIYDDNTLRGVMMGITTRMFSSFNIPTDCNDILEGSFEVAKLIIIARRRMSASTNFLCGGSPLG